MWMGNDHVALRRCWHPVAWSEDVGETPLQVTLCGERWVVARLDGSDSPVSALRDRCPHRFTPLSAGRVVGGTFVCPYHGWRFGGDGRCAEIPALGLDVPAPAHAACLAAAGVAERFGLVWLALEPPVVPLPEVPEWGDGRYAVLALPRQEWSAGAAQMADNFLDVAHFPFTHTATIGDAADRLVGPCHVERHGWSFTAVYEHSARSLLGAVDDDRPAAGRRMEFTAYAPHHLRLRLDYPGERTTIVLLFFHQPVDARTTRLFGLELADNVADGRLTAEDAVAFQMAVAKEDRDLLELMELKSIPLDLTVEHHTRADRITVELRRLLADVVAAAAVERESAVDAPMGRL
jgi:vanillate O-demethylase monooxygenase subunit